MFSVLNNLPLRKTYFMVTVPEMTYLDLETFYIFQEGSVAGQLFRLPGQDENSKQPETFLKIYVHII